MPKENISSSQNIASSSVFIWLFPNEGLWWDLGIGRESDSRKQKWEFKGWESGSKHHGFSLIGWVVSQDIAPDTSTAGFWGLSSFSQPQRSQEVERLVTCPGWRWRDQGRGRRCLCYLGMNLNHCEMWLQPKMDKKMWWRAKKNSCHQASLYRLLAEEARAWRSQDYALQAARTTKRDWAVVGEPTWFSPNLSAWWSHHLLRKRK